MNMPSIRSNQLLVLGAALAAALSVYAQAPLPAVHKSDGTEYLSGGIGSDEARAIEATAAHWPMTLEFAVKDKQRSEFAAHVKVAVRDASGKVVLSTYAEGPFLLARVPAGRYAVEAQFGGLSLHQTVDVKDGHAARALFLWPAGAGTSSNAGQHN